MLASYTPGLSQFARRSLEQLGVSVWTGTRVTSIEPGLVRMGTKCSTPARVSDGGGFQHFVAEAHASGFDICHTHPGPHCDSALFERPARKGRQFRRIGGQHIRAAFDQDHARGFRLIERKSWASACWKSRQGSCKLHASRAAADDDKRQQLLLAGPITFSFGAFKSDEHLAPNRDRVLHRFEAWRVRLPFVVAEVRGPRACRQNQVVVLTSPSARRRRLPGTSTDTASASQTFKLFCPRTQRSAMLCRPARVQP